MKIKAYASCGFLLFGYDQGVMSGIISAPQFLETFPQLNPDLVGTSRSALLQALYVALYEIGCLGGAIFCLAFGGLCFFSFLKHNVILIQSSLLFTLTLC
jgi:hypothetical protein